VVPPARLERALPYGKRILSPLRLPIPPRGLAALKRYALGRGDTPDIERGRAAAQLELRQLEKRNGHGKVAVQRTHRVERRRHGARQQELPCPCAPAKPGRDIHGVPDQGGALMARRSQGAE